MSCQVFRLVKMFVTTCAVDVFGGACEVDNSGLWAVKVKLASDADVVLGGVEEMLK